jgi:integrase/recombinase XerD
MNPTQDPDRSPMTEMIEAYFKWMQVKNYSEATIESRGFILKYFRVWCHERGITRPRDVTRPVLERYQRHLHHYRGKDNRKLTIRTQHVRLTAVRSFFSWLSRYKHILYNPASELEMPRSEYRLPRSILNHQEVEQVMRQVDFNDPMALRDRAILETLYSTGMRRSELCHLNIRDLDSDRGLVMIRQGKNNKDRLIPIGNRALAWLDKYLYDLRPFIAVDPGSDDGTLFLTKHGQPLRPKHLTRLVRQYIGASGIEKEGSCHIFRHSMATLMLEGGADTRYIQSILGHASLDTTQIYTQVAITKLKEVHSRTHPGAELKREPTEPQDSSQ